MAAWGSLRLKSTLRGTGLVASGGSLLGLAGVREKQQLWAEARQAAQEARARMVRRWRLVFCRSSDGEQRP